MPKGRRWSTDGSSVNELQDDLWSFDESDEFQQWCADWTKPRLGGDLILLFEASSRVVVTWKSGVARPMWTGAAGT